MDTSHVSIYVTGFGPFMGVEDNPSSVLCETLQKYVQEGIPPENVPGDVLRDFEASDISLLGLRALDVAAQTCQTEVPEIHRSLREKKEAFPKTETAVVHLGVAGNRKHISLECRGVNEANFRVPDVLGWQCCGEPVIDDSPPVLYCSLRLPEILAEMHDKGVNCEISTDAGRYVCNYIFFQSLHLAPHGTPVLFVHVPPFEDMVQEVQVTALLCLFVAIARQLRGAAPSVPAPSARPLG
ncbi:pcp [Symbiodinium sp. CCMP2592]|nr:pcp [Symbiodinium sp. CCMP2592]